ncbi:hypothetical protein IQ260_19720 [Leptolyngbya cf. ectocarpi LEGE 11479]|uniref:Uncharacterized protein n=1 Tax=Leptolyngbya cf. ectocarpi LEGE 11479 TaxID=1828722 RepID=A0A928ZWR0_LEPEC|nr:hypothetical protein [Leptolyngbya ectocarpi]MBE9068876.1 hypothetical protein [Leptolyngbya cf. ectocarpi LEGE 11479]
MELNQDVMKAVETLEYRVTAGDVAAKTGLNISQAEAGVLALASATQAHMQVADTGDIAYEFPRQFRATLRNRYWQLRWQETWQKIWAVLFYLIRISFGIMLILAVVLVFAAIIAIQIGMQSQQDEDNRGGYRGGMGFNPWLWIGRDWFYWFSYGPQRQYGRQSHSPRGRSRQDSGKLNFLEGIYSFLFGDGDPNKDLDERRWSAIATVIRNNRGAVTAEQLAPYLDNANLNDDLEDYVIPALSRFNGRPKVSPQGDLVYYFPELQVTAKNHKPQSVPAFLKETKRRFTSASSDQVTIAIGLGTLLVVGSIYLGFIAAGWTTGFIGLIYSLCDLFLAYGIAFLGIPAIRYFWMQGQNQKIEARNTQRQNLVGKTIQRKLDYTKQFAIETIVGKDNLAYTTETDLIDQEIANRDKIDEEWRKRLESS